MPPNTTPTPVEQLWTRLGETYGFDALDRRFGRTPPEAWRETVNAMPAHELQRAMRRLLHSGKPHVPTLTEFVKLAKAVGDDAEPMKPASPFALEGPRMDPWAMVGNQHLMAEIWKNPRRFASPDCGRITAILVRAKNTWVETMRDTIEEDREDGGKSIWASLMRQAEAEIERQRGAAVS